MKNRPGAIVMLSLALFFVLMSIGLLSLSAYFSVDALYKIYGPGRNLGEALYGLLLFIFLLPSCFASMFVSGGILPFILILRAKFQVKTWWSMMILVYAIIAIVASFFLLFALPITTSIVYSARGSSIRSSSSSFVY